MCNESYGLCHPQKHAVFQTSARVHGELESHRWAKWVGCRGFLWLSDDYGTHPYNQPDNGHGYSSTVELRTISLDMGDIQDSLWEIKANWFEGCKVLKNKVADN